MAVQSVNGKTNTFVEEWDENLVKVPPQSMTFLSSTGPL